jgi:hypothetical protein
VIVALVNGVDDVFRLGELAAVERVVAPVRVVAFHDELFARVREQAVRPRGDRIAIEPELVELLDVLSDGLERRFDGVRGDDAKFL